MMNRFCCLAVLALLSAATARAEVDKKAERLWKSKCGACHGADGKGQTDQGQKMKVADMTQPAWQKKVSDDDIRKALKEGVKRTQNGVKQEMDAFADLKPEQVDALMSFVRSLGSK